MGKAEGLVERKLVDAVRAKGGLCEKWTAGTAGWPDRIVLLFDGKLGFVETKAKGKKPRRLQIYRHSQLRKLGFKVYVLDEEKDIERIIDEICST